MALFKSTPNYDLDDVRNTQSYEEWWDAREALRAVPDDSDEWEAVYEKMCQAYYKAKADGWNNLDKDWM